jgi:hypothetical protein
VAHVVDPTDLVRAALIDVGLTLVRLPGRKATSGLHEVKELGPGLRDSLVRVGVADSRVELNYTARMTNWNRPRSQIDVVVLESNGQVEIGLELKVWDIGHQLFDLAKLSCLLAAGAATTFLVCVAERERDFDRRPGGELFAAHKRERREHDFVELIAKHRHEWQRHVGKSGPEPTSVAMKLTTTAVSDTVAINAYPGHAARAAQVDVTDATPVPLHNGWPDAVARPAPARR